MDAPEATQLGGPRDEEVGEHADPEDGGEEGDQVPPFVVRQRAVGDGHLEGEEERPSQRLCDRRVAALLLLLLLLLLLVLVLERRHGDPARAVVDGDHDLVVEEHEANVGTVGEAQAGRLDSRYSRVLQDQDHRGDGHAVEQAVAREGLPVELEHKGGEERGATDDAAQVEDGRADDGADAHVVLDGEDAHERGEELWRRRARRHESSAGNVGREAERLGYILERGDKVVVAHDGEPPEHVEDAPDQHAHCQEHVVCVEERVANARLILEEGAPLRDVTLLSAPERAGRPRSTHNHTRSQSKLWRCVQQGAFSPASYLPGTWGGPG